MSEPFDPYYDWLGIPPEDQPPDHYRLLGVKRYEGNAAAISNAADQRVRHLRSVQTGKRMAESQKLLSEVATASTCLLTPDRKQAYDEQLRQKEATSRPHPVPVARPLAVQPHSAPVPGGDGLPQAKALDSPAAPFVAVSAAGYSSAARKSASGKVFILAGAVTLTLLLMLGAGAAVVVYNLSRTEVVDVPETFDTDPPVVLPAPAGPPHPIPANLPVVPPPEPERNPSRAGPSPPDRTPVSLPPGGNQSTPSTPSPPLDLNVEVGSAVDLLKGPRSVLSGSMSIINGKLKTGGVAGDKVEFTYVPPSQYLIDMAITRDKGNEVFALQIVVEGRPCAVLIDAFADQGSYSGLEMIRGQRVNSPTSPASIKGKQLENGKLSRLRCLVVKNHVVVEMDGKILVNWKGDPNSLSRDRVLAVSTPNHLGVFTWDSSYLIDSMRLYPVTKHNLDRGNTVANASPPPGSTEPGPPPSKGRPLTFGLPGNVLVQAGPLADLLKDTELYSHGGAFAKKGSILSIEDKGPCRIEFGYVLPSEYVIEALVTRQPAGVQSLSFLFAVSGRPCLLCIDGALGTRTGLELIDGKKISEQSSTAMGQQLNVGQTANLRAVVLKNRVVLFCNGRPVVDWSGDPAQLDRPETARFCDVKKLGLSSWNSSFDVTRLTVRPVVATNQMSVASTTPPPVSARTLNSLRAGNLDLKLAAPVDLLRDINKRPRGGSMSWGTSSLTTSDNNQCSMEFEYEPPAEYVLVGQVTRKSGSDLIGVNVVYDGRPCTVVIDGFSGPVSGLEMIDGKRADENLTAVKGPVLQNDKPAALKIAVLKNRIIAEVDGRTLVDWRGAASQLSPHYRIGSGKTIAVTTWNSTYEVRDLRVYPITDSSIASGVASAPPADGGVLGTFNSRPKERVPDEAAQEKSKQRMKEAFGPDIAKATKPDEKFSLAKKFVEVASTGEDTSTRYVLLTAARKMALGALEFEYAVSLVNHLARDYEVDALALKLQTLQEAVGLPGVNSLMQERLSKLAEALTIEAEESERMDIVEPASKLALDSVNKTKDVARKKAIKALRDRIVDDKERWDAAQAAIKALETTPDDPAQNLIVGKFYSLQRDDWSRALPHLTKGEDQEWAAAAKAELAAQDGESKLAVAEAWQVLTSTVPAADKIVLQEHEMKLIEAAIPQLAGLDKAKAEKRLGDLKTMIAAAEKAEPEKTAARSKKIGRVTLLPGLMVRVIASSQPTYALGIVSSSADFETAAAEPIRNAFGHWSDSYFHMIAVGYIVLDQDEPVKFDLENCVCSVNGNKVADTQGSGATSLELKLKKGRHAIMIARSVRSSGGPKFRITTVESRKNPLFFSPQDLQIEMAKPYQYNGRTSTGQLLFGNPGS